MPPSQWKFVLQVFCYEITSYKNLVISQIKKLRNSKLYDNEAFSFVTFDSLLHFPQHPLCLKETLLQHLSGVQSGSVNVNETRIFITLLNWKGRTFQTEGKKPSITYKDIGRTDFVICFLFWKFRGTERSMNKTLFKIFKNTLIVLPTSS